MFGGIGMTEMVILGVAAVLLFGKKLPEVAKTLGGSYREFRKGIFDFQSTMNSSIDEPASKPKSSSRRTDYDDYEAATAPKFVPPSAAPTSSDSSDS